MNKQQLETQLRNYEISIKVASEKEKEFLINFLDLNKKRHKYSWETFSYLENSLSGPVFFSSKKDTTDLILAADIMEGRYPLGREEKIKQIIKQFATNNSQINLSSEATQDLLAQEISDNI